jgi:hypothetical protein
MKTELKTITPKWAAYILQTKGRGNRPIRWKHVDWLAGEISAGRWKINGDTICYNAEKILDGQHRLLAIVKAGVEVQSLVVDGLPSHIMNTKDEGKRRTGADTMCVIGEKNNARLAACLSLVHRYYTGTIKSRTAFSNCELENLLETYPDIRTALQGREKNQLISPSIINACFYIFRRISPELAIEFVERILRGIGVEAGTPWHALRNRLFANSVATSKLPQEHIMALCIKAWNIARNGKMAKDIRYRPSNEEKFPAAK